MRTKESLKKAVLLLFIAMLVFTLPSCHRKTVADKDGAATRYSFNEIEDEKYEGLFTLNSDGTFSPLPEKVPGFDGKTDKADPERFLWYTDNRQDFTSLIPTVTSETPIVIIYDSDRTMPDKSYWYLEKYRPLGATIGAHVKLDKDKTMYLTEDTLKGTSAERVFESAENSSKDNEHTLMEVSGGSVKLPIDNVEPNVNMLLGLDYGKKYTFKYLQGTKTKKVDLVADVQAFQSEELIVMNAPYKQTEDGYFIINMPLGLSRGFYYISDLGFFFYEGGN